MSHTQQTVRSAMKEFESYMRVERNYAENTVRGYGRELSLWLRFLGSDYTLNSITTQHVREWLSSLQNYKPASVERKITALKSFFNFCQDQDWVIANPCNKIKFPKRGKRLPKYLNDEELQIVLNTPFTKYLSKPNMDLEVRDATIFRILALCGLRRSEIIGLNVEDVSLGEGIIIVREAKEDKDRIVPLTRELILWMRKYIGWREKTFKHTQSHALFLSFTGSRIDYNAIQKLFKRHMRICGIKKHITPHGLRHSFSISLLRKGVDLVTISELLGHANLSSTQVYLQSDLKQKQLAISKLSSFINNDQLRI
jgi:site-specific recombinase XerD